MIRQLSVTAVILGLLASAVAGPPAARAADQWAVRASSPQRVAASFTTAASGPEVTLALENKTSIADSLHLGASAQFILRALGLSGTYSQVAAWKPGPGPAITCLLGANLGCATTPDGAGVLVIPGSIRGALVARAPAAAGRTDLAVGPNGDSAAYDVAFIAIGIVFESLGVPGAAVDKVTELALELRPEAVIVVNALARGDLRAAGDDLLALVQRAWESIKAKAAGLFVDAAILAAIKAAIPGVLAIQFAIAVAKALVPIGNLVAAALGNAWGTVTVAYDGTATAMPTPTPARPIASRWLKAGRQKIERVYAHLVPVPGGRALLVGNDNHGTPGGTTWGNSRAVEIYDVATNSWTRTGSLNAERAFFVALPLQDGRVLVTGGLTEWNFDDPHSPQAYSSTKLWNPKTGTWTAGALLNTAREAPFGVVLADGRVMVGAGRFQDGEKGNDLRSVEIYDPHTDKWTRTGSLHHSITSWDGVTRSGGADAVLLSDGRVLVVGGFWDGGEDFAGDWRPSAEIWSPRTGRWTELTGLPDLLADSGFSVVSLATGADALVIGGAEPAGAISREVVRFDGRSLRWSRAAPLRTPRTGASAVRLSDGRILVVGGLTPDVAVTPLDGGALIEASVSAEIYDPARDRWTSAGDMPVGRYRGAMALLDDGTVLITAGGTGKCEGCTPGPWTNDREPAARFSPGSP